MTVSLDRARFGIVRIDTVTSHHGPPGGGGRVIHKEISITGKIRVECETKKALFVALVADPALYIEKSVGRTGIGAVIENLNDACLLNHENPVRTISGCLKIHGAGEADIRKRFLKPQRAVRHRRLDNLILPTCGHCKEQKDEKTDR